MENPRSKKHQLMRGLLEDLGIPVLPDHFSEGSTVTAKALGAVRNRLRLLHRNMKRKIGKVQKDLDALKDMVN